MTATLPPAYGVRLDAAARPHVSMEARVLQRAADLLITDGWCQGGERDAAGGRCAINALATAACHLSDPLTPYNVDFVVRQFVHDVLEDRYPDFDGHIDHWNDRPNVTVDDVLDVLAAARELVGRES